MRFIPTFCLKEEMLLGKSIYNDNGMLLLKEGSIMKQQYINKVIELGIQGVYIEDEISKDIKVENVISDELRLNTVQKIKDIFIDIENEQEEVEHHIGPMGIMVDDIVDELINNKDVIVNMLDIKVFDDYTFAHSVNVAILSIIMGIALDLNRNDLNNLGMGAILHDIGKIFIDKECLNKKGKLTDDEFEQIKKHPTTGYKYIRAKFNIPVQASVGVLHHHEKYDGTGYPNQKIGEDISLFGRIIAIADVYDAITSNRSYRKAVLPSKAMEYIMGSVDSHLDFDLVSLFIKKIAAYPLGTCVKLSNGQIGIVVENFSDATMRPKIKLIDGEDTQEKYINLKEDFKNNNLIIVDTVVM